ncbi:MAG: hypothetical protein QG661_2436 [Actinomycetota bacterium]|nr:hypothetical protein [Actinomycetota bacterium]
MATRFTMDDLRTHLPTIQNGTPREREEAQVALLRAMEGLVRHWTGQEYHRAQPQFPNVNVEDVRSTVVAHLLLAFDAFDLNKAAGSPTNWLYHRMVNGTRRELARTLGDVQFTRYFLENARRVHSIITRLTSELGREPTDAEIIAASAQAGVGALQLGPKDRVVTQRKPVSAHFLASYRANQAMLLHADLPEDDQLSVPGPEDAAEAAAVGSALREIYLAVAERSGLDQESMDVVFCTFGIAPFSDPQDTAAAAVTLDVTVARVRSVLSGWAKLCATVNGPMHAVISELDPDTALDLGLGPVLDQLGPFTPGVRVTVPAALRCSAVAA